MIAWSNRDQRQIHVFRKASQHGYTPATIGVFILPTRYDLTRYDLKFVIEGYVCHRGRILSSAYMIREYAMKSRQIQIGLAIVSGLIASGLTLAASNLFVYPAKGQNAQQQEKDKFECYQWAKQNTGIDPTRISASSSGGSSQSSSGSGGAVARGALGGALTGAVIAGVADGDAGKGAAVGALGGGLFGGIRHDRQQQQRQQQQAQQQAASRNAQLDTYNRAYGACLEGRGYTVK